ALSVLTCSYRFHLNGDEKAVLENAQTRLQKRVRETLVLAGEAAFSQAAFSWIFFACAHRAALFMVWPWT
ncbi:MAG: hypothetical protein RR283_10495, partial [Comamonas sp.]